MARSALQNVEDAIVEGLGKLWILVLIAGLFPVSTGIASSAQRPKDSQRTFTAPDGTFQVTYPDILTRCELQSQKSRGGYYWTQPECSAYIPPCGEDPVPNQPIVCIAYPHNRYTNSATFQAATFSVDETNAAERDCLTPSDTKSGEIRIRGVKFKVFESADAAMNRSRNTRGYVTFHNGKCYGMGITIVTTNAQVFDPPAKELTKKQWVEVNGQLERVRDSFRFLK